jgi:hypothetical protein
MAKRSKAKIEAELQSITGEAAAQAVKDDVKPPYARDEMDSDYKPSKPKRAWKTEFIISLFEKNYKAKLTDQQLAAEIKKTFVGTKSNWLARMKALRRMFNRGLLPGQDKEKKIWLDAYGPDKQKITVRPGPVPKGTIKPVKDGVLEACLDAPTTASKAKR